MRLFNVKFTGKSDFKLKEINSLPRYEFKAEVNKIVNTQSFIKVRMHYSNKTFTTVR